MTLRFGDAADRRMDSDPTWGTSSQQYGMTARERRADERAQNESRPTIARCLDCRWKHEGTLAECREAHRAHRAEAHPERPQIARSPVRRKKAA